jgi:small subunit ribosomal protein S8
MTMTDPIADMLTRVRNANTAMHDSTNMPSSKLKEKIAAILASEGYIAGFEVKDDSKRPGRTLEIQLKYSPERRRTISGIRRVSKPGLRVYAGSDRLPRVLGGLGIAILSTSQGLLTDTQAKKRGIGGEVLCYVW